MSGKKDEKNILGMVLQGDEIADFFEELNFGITKEGHKHSLKAYSLFSRETGSLNYELLTNAFTIWLLSEMLSKINAGQIDEIKIFYESLALFLSYQFFGSGTLIKELLLESIKLGGLKYKLFLKRAQKAYTNKEEGYWKHMSFDIKLPTLNIEQAFGPNPDIKYTIDNAFVERSPLLFKLLTPLIFSRPENHITKSWVGIDLLFRNDKRYELPTLTIIVRTQKKKLKFPKNNQEKVNSIVSSPVFISGTMPDLK